MSSYRSTCRSCGGQLYVVSGEFESSPMPLHHDGFSFTEAKQVSTENEVIHCSLCDTTLTLADCVLQCIDCDDKGWGHYEGNLGRKIQRCDCGTFLADDDAKAAHKLDCGCGWGEPWHRQLYEVSVKVIVSAPPDQAAEVDEVIGRVVATSLPGLVTDLPAGGLMNVCSSGTAGTQVHAEHPSRKQLVEFGVLNDE